MILSRSFSVIFVLYLSTVKSEDVNVDCSYSLWESVYTCTVALLTVPDDPSINFIIEGSHLAGRTDNDVRRINVYFSDVPIVISQLFEKFPNVEFLDSVSGGLRRIQSNAFASAENLRRINIGGSRSFETIEANAFVGARRLVDLDLNINGIETIHETAFNGLDSLENLELHSNRIRELPTNVFASLPSLKRLDMFLNSLRTIDGRLFANNSRIQFINLAQNLIDEVGRSFLDGMNQLDFLSMRGNRCLDIAWRIGGATTIETIRRELEPCFPKSEPKPEGELRRFVIEVQGPLKLMFENGTEIVTV
jgi:hypothetical protein